MVNENAKRNSETERIRYTFLFGAARKERIEIEILEDSDTSVESDEEFVPAWLALDTYRCDDCRIPPGSRKTCPAAQSIRPVVDMFRRHVSCETVDLIVEMHGVKLESQLPLQIAIRSLITLLLPLSACPVFGMLRPLAHLHLPFSDKEHSIFRALGTYLIAQYLRSREGLKPDWELNDLQALIGRIHRANKMLATRLRRVPGGDASINSLVSFDVVAAMVELSLDDTSEKLKPILSMYLKDY